MLRWNVIAALLLLFTQVVEAKPRGAPGPPQIFYNIVTDGGATCNDNHVVVTRNTSITSGTAILTTPGVDTFVSGDVGKYIKVPGAAGGAGTLQTTIQTFTNARQVTLAANAGTTLSSVSTSLTYGTDDSPAFKAFNVWARANQGANNQVVLTIPPGSNCWTGSSQTISGGYQNNSFFVAINNLIVEATGAAITSVDGTGFPIGGAGICHKGLAEASGCSARIETAYAGNTQIYLTAASFGAGYISRFNVGTWIMVGGLDTQGQWNFPLGYPPNSTYFEWRQITAICNNTAGCPGLAIITLDRPLSNTYLSTWPNYNSGNSNEADAGGPATIWALDSSWNTTQEFHGLTITQGGQTNGNGRNIIWRNATMGDTFGNIPSQNETWSAYNSDFTNVDMEVDKLIGTLTFDGMLIRIVGLQSNSVDRFIMRNSTVDGTPGAHLSGSAKYNEITDSTIKAWTPGTLGYGNATTNICVRCTIPTFVYAGGIEQAGSEFTPYSMSGGVISFANTSAIGSGPPQRIMSPLPTNIFYTVGGSFGGTIGLFRPQSMTQDATNVYVQTNEAGGFPSWAAGLRGFRAHPSPQWTCTDPDSSSDATMKATCTNSGAIALNPLGSYASASYAPASAAGNLTRLIAMGKIVSLTIDVTQAYSGSGSATLNPTGQFHNEAVKQSDWSGYDWVPTINLKQAGRRVITPSGTTCDGVTGSGPGGSCSGDTCTLPASGCYSLPEAVWIKDSLLPFMGSTLGVGNQPLFTITIQTDQGVVP